MTVSQRNIHISKLLWSTFLENRLCQQLHSVQKSGAALLGAVPRLLHFDLSLSTNTEMEVTYALMSVGNPAGTQYLRCSKRADNKSCEGCGTLRTAEFEQFVYGEMVKKLSEFQTLTAKATTVNPKLTALNVELAQVEDEIEKLLNTLTGANAVLLSYANGKIEELDANRQRLIKEIAALNAETISPQKIEFLSAHLENWNTIDFDDRRQVTDIILSQVQATSDRVSFEWKI